MTRRDRFGRAAAPAEANQRPCRFYSTCAVSVLLVSSMAKHYELEHPGHKVPAELSEIGSAEKERLKKEWGKIEKKRPTKRSAYNRDTG